MRISPSSLLLLPLLGCAPHIDGAAQSPAGSEQPAVLEQPAAAEQPEEDVHVTYAQHGQNSDSVRESLAALEQLNLLTVREMLVDAPAASGHCYGPCEHDPVDQAWMAEHARQTRRLAQFVQLANEVATEDHGESDELTDAMESLDSLELLDIVGANTGHCYAPCTGDAEKRARINALADLSSDL